MMDLDVNVWRINFDLKEKPSSFSKATFTIQLAGAKTTAGNTDNASGSNPNFNVCLSVSCLCEMALMTLLLDHT